MRLSSQVAADPQVQAVAQFLALAASANVYFDLVADRVVIRAINPDWRAWAGVRAYLDEIGMANVEAYFRRTSADERERYARVA